MYMILKKFILKKMYNKEMSRILEKKKIFIIIVAIIVLAVVGTIIFIINKHNNNLKDSSSSYKIELEEFAEACKSEKKMKKYLDKHFDFKGSYAMNKSSELSEFEELYKNAKKTDYESDIEETEEFCFDFVSKNKDVKIVEIGDYIKGVGDFYGGSITLKIDNVETKFTLTFYNGKLVDILKTINSNTLKKSLNAITGK